MAAKSSAVSLTFAMSWQPLMFVDWMVGNVLCIFNVCCHLNVKRDFEKDPHAQWVKVLMLT